MRRLIVILILLFSFANVKAQSSDTELTKLVNVFLGTSGDHGQLSPAASYPFSMLSIGPQTYPKLHAGYEYEAKRFLGFTHNRVEGVGCQGSGGNLLIKPFVGNDIVADLIKTTQSGHPGYYSVSFDNKIKAEVAVYKKSGIHKYLFPTGEKGFVIDFDHSLANKFVAEEHVVKGNVIAGWIEARTTCNVGTYKFFYVLKFDQKIVVKITKSHQLVVKVADQDQNVIIRVGFSSVNTAFAESSIFKGSFDQLTLASTKGWQESLSKIKIEGNQERKKLFYSLLYRSLQSPYNISESDGTFRGTNGIIQHSSQARYNGWAVWDNYRTQLPLLSIGWPDNYKGMVTSLEDLYVSGKKDYATQTEPSNTVRTEHTIVVLLDSYRKGYPVNFEKIADSLIKEVDQLDFSKPDKALESSYDTWALSEILAILKKPSLSEKYKLKALEYRKYWNDEFKDITKKDVDRVQARGLYQGTIWQYRWFAPFDVKGLIELTGGMKNYLEQLNYFFENDLYNHANEPDLQVPSMYNVTATPSKSQELMHRFALDTVIQYYFNDNSRGIDPFVDRVYKNEPKAYIRTMDDDAGAMSAWFVLTSCGFMPACSGYPVYYLNVPLFKSATFQLANNKRFSINVKNYSLTNKYISQVVLNGKEITRNYITHQEIINGGKLVITASSKPSDQNSTQLWVSEVK